MRARPSRQDPSVTPPPPISLIEGSDGGGMVTGMGAGDVNAGDVSAGDVSAGT